MRPCWKWTPTTPASGRGPMLAGAASPEAGRSGVARSGTAAGGAQRRGRRATSELGRMLPPRTGERLLERLWLGRCSSFLTAQNTHLQMTQKIQRLFLSPSLKTINCRLQDSFSPHQDLYSLGC